jgi:hypothetical protein
MKDSWVYVESMPGHCGRWDQKRMQKPKAVASFSLTEKPGDYPISSSRFCHFAVSFS